MSSVLTFLFVWGVYLITPVLVDGVDALVQLVVVLRDRYRHRRDTEPEEPTDWPTLSVIVPAHNEAAVIDRCLTSLRNQDYPSDRLEVIVVDDGSSDGTGDLVEAHVRGEGTGHSMMVRSKPIHVGPFAGKIALIRGVHGGKSKALNAGIAQSTGEIIVNIDSDVVLAHDAARQIALAFMRNPQMDAATGNIQVDWEILEGRDEGGRIMLDEHGHIVPHRLAPFELYLAKCQFLEYLSSFDIGRRSQALTSTMYTLAGACSAYRRSVVAGGVEYSSTTLSEDTALTFDLHRRGATIGYMAEANVHLEPVTDLDELYGQRVRWARGQLEVCGLNDDLIGKKGSSLGRLALPKMLMYDHTFAFPRLLWAPLFLFFPLLGYSWRTILFALIAMYLFYVVIEVVHSLSSYATADDFIRSRVDRCGWAVLGMPLYRLIVFYYRFSGYLITLKDEQRWSASGPVQTTRRDLQSAARATMGIFSVVGIAVAAITRVGVTVAAVPAVAFVLKWLSGTYGRTPRS